jgi:recombination protein RecA
MSPQEQVAAAVAMLQAELGGDAAANLRDGIRSDVREVLPTGIEVLDRHVLGIGGLPYGRVVEVFGNESAGKSSFGWQVMGAAQRDGALVAFGESEPALSPSWIGKFGVDLAAVIRLGCDNLEQFSKGMELLLDRFMGAKKMVIILDSVTSLLPLAAIKAHADDKETYAVMARGWSDLLGNVVQKLADRNALLLLLNQVRSKVGVVFGNPNQSTGGNAIKFYSSIRIAMKHGEFEKKGATRIGQWSEFHAIKNKLAKPHHDCAAYLSFDGGWDDVASTLLFAKTTGALKRESKDIEEARRNLGWTADPEQK